MKLSVITAAAFLPCFLAMSACQTQQPSARHSAEQPLSNQHLVLDSSTIIRGDIYAETVTIPAGTKVTLSDDVVIRAKQIIINGSLNTISNSYLQGNTAPQVILMADESISIRGNITGGKALAGSHQGEAGQDGSTIILDAPIIYVNGPVRGGDGGNGGIAASGGLGGSVFLFGVGGTDDGNNSAIIGGHGGISGQVTPETIDRAPFLSSGAGGHAIVLQLNNNPQDIAEGKSRLQRLRTSVAEILSNG